MTSILDITQLLIYYTINERNEIGEDLPMEKVWKPNTTMNIPIDLLDRVAIFVKNTPEIKSRNILIEKSLNYFMDHWEDIRNKTSLVA